MIEIVDGNILDSKEDIICHQVNCQGAMGSGVALAISTRWPVVRREYLRFCKEFPDDKSLLGRCQLIEVAPGQLVANVFGQLEYGRDKYKRYTDYVALTNAFNELRNNYGDNSIAFPFGFGCGLANGDWKIVSNIIEIYFGEMNVRIYKLPE